MAFAICFTVEVVKTKEKPFEMSVSVSEEGGNSQLPPIEGIEISISIEGERIRKDTITSLNNKAVFGQLPGRMIGKSMRLMVRNATCYNIDTIIPVEHQVIVKLLRQPDYYGKIKTIVIKDEEPLCNQWVSVEGMKSKTNEDGELLMDIPFSIQRERYSIIYGEYSGTIHMPCIGTKCVELKK